jgi:hypothetical protein
MSKHELLQFLHSYYLKLTSLQTQNMNSAIFSYVTVTMNPPAPQSLKFRSLVVFCRVLTIG